jgi:hypothetical protein
MPKTARCCCQAASITVHGEPSINAVCHCSSCKRRTGSAFGMSIYFADRDVVDVTGDFRVYEVPAQRYFCARCGTTLYWRSDHFPGLTGIATGCFVGEDMPEPTMVAQSGDRFPWVGLPDRWNKFS